MCTQSMMVKVMIVKVMMEQIYTSIHFLTEKLMMLKQIKLQTVVKMCIQMR